MLLHTEEKHRRKLNDSVTGPLRTIGNRVEEKSYVPHWWHGDETASSQSIAAMNTMQKRRRRKAN